MYQKQKKIVKFNPIKEDKDGVLARRAVWSTDSINLALQGLEEGRKLIANPFYEYNTKLLKGDLVFDRTPEEIEEWKHCASDIIYFAEKYCKLMTPDGIQHIHLRDYQQDYLNHLMKNRLSIFLSCRQSGKCLSFTSCVKVKVSPDAVAKLKKSWKKHYFIEEDIYYVPIFEIINLHYSSRRWKIKYFLYKILYKLERCLQN